MSDLSLNASDGPKFHMEDAQGQTRVQNEPDSPEFHMEDVADPTSVQDNAEGLEFIKQVQELLDKLEEGSHYSNGIEFIKVDHTILEE